VHLDDVGREQAARTGERIAAVPLVALVTSPLERCRETAQAITDRQAVTPTVLVDERVTECDYGTWQGRPLRELATEPLWVTVQGQPSAVVFPGGESLAGMQARGVAAVRERDAAITAEHGPGAVWAVVTHGDLIKALLADALGMHLDLFQRIGPDPASVSIVRYGPRQPDVVAMNTTGGDLSWLRTAAPGGDAPVGGGAGPSAPTA
jgi:probable phosphomutase (TIGR03848 family)